jgi:hypothetical protein
VATDEGLVLQTPDAAPADTPAVDQSEQFFDENGAPIIEEEGDSDTPTETKVAETDEEKAARLVKLGKVREQRQQKKVQERINELVHKQRATEEQNSKLLSLLLGKQGGNASPAGKSDGPPQQKDFTDYDQFIEAKASYAAKQAAKEMVEAATKQQAQQSQQQQHLQQAHQVRKQFEGRMADYSKTVPDWVETVEENHDIELPDPAIAMIHMRDDGPAILYAIGKNPALAQRLEGQPAHMQAMLIGEIGASLKQSPRVSKAPTPGKPVGSKPGSSGDPPTDSTAYMAWAAKNGL